MVEVKQVKNQQEQEQRLAAAHTDSIRTLRNEKVRRPS
jgi:hypothetical protein